MRAYCRTWWFYLPRAAAAPAVGPSTYVTNKTDEIRSSGFKYHNDYSIYFIERLVYNIIVTLCWGGVVAPRLGFLLWSCGVAPGVPISGWPPTGTPPAPATPGTTPTPPTPPSGPTTDPPPPIIDGRCAFCCCCCCDKKRQQQQQLDNDSSIESDALYPFLSHHLFYVPIVSANVLFADLKKSRGDGRLTWSRLLLLRLLLNDGLKRFQLGHGTSPVAGSQQGEEDEYAAHHRDQYHY